MSESASVSRSKSWSVYRHTCPDGKVYIGATGKLPRVRWNYGYGYRNSLFYTVIRKYGWNNILHEVLATNLTEEQAFELEEKLIAEHDSTNPDKGYNLAKGRGSTGVVISEETRQRLVASHLGKKNPHTPEWNQKIREGNLGKKKPHVGVPRSRECRKKMSEALSIPVVQYDKQLNFIKEYPSGREAMRQTGVNDRGISRCCRGLAKSAGGYIWKHKHNFKEEKQNG